MAVESAQLVSVDEEDGSEKTETALLVLAEDESENFDVAMKSVNVDEWKLACQKEVDTLQSYNTWELVSSPPKANIVGSHWTFRVKPGKCDFIATCYTPCNTAPEL